MYTSKGEVLGINNSLTIQDRIKKNDVKRFSIAWSTFNLISGDGKSILLNSDNVKIVEIDSFTDGILYGDKLFDSKENSLIELDLKNITERK